MPHFDAIASGRVSAQEAKNLILSHWTDPDTPLRAYNALAAWVWTAVSQRHATRDLWEWYHLVRALENRMCGREDAAIIARFRVLEDMIEMCIQMSARPRLPEILDKPGVRSLLIALDRAPNGALDRDVLSQVANLRDAAVSRVLNLLVLEGLVETRGFAEPVQITGWGRESLR